MKNILTTALVIAMVIFLSLPSKILAGGDTLVVHASGESLDKVINSDTAAGGFQKHKVYKLVTTDTTYLYLGAISVKSDITVIGVIGKSGRLPCIQPGILSDGSMPAILFIMNGQGTKGVFKNFYIFELTTNNGWDWGKDFLLTGDNIKLYLDNIIVDENRGEIVAFSGKSDSFFITNCKFRNGVYPTNWFSSNVLVNDYPTNNPADSIVMKYNTVFCINSRVAQAGWSAPTKYFEFDHNTVVYSFTGIFGLAGALTAKITNNIFFGVYAAGGNEKLWLPKVPPIVSFSKIDSTTDLTRNVQLKNNVYFQPKKITDFWANWNKTAGAKDSIYIPVWMDAQTISMFNDKKHWPHFVQSGNLVGVDPGFGSSILNVIDNASGTPGVVGLLKYIELVKTNKITNEVWGYKPQTVTGNYWIPAWPLPEEASGDLAYSTELTAPDGKPYGDSYWFTIAPTPGNFTVVSNGRSYVSSPPGGSSYPDPNGTKLTDGSFAPDSGQFKGANLAGDPAWVGYLPPNVQNVVIDLGKVMPVQQFMGDYLLDSGWGIFLHHVDVSVSTDNATYTYLDSLRDSEPKNSAPSAHKFYCTLSNPVNARYVKFSTVAPNAWVFVEEYQVLSPVVTSIRQEPSPVPTMFDLSQNYPNPFNPSTKIKFNLPSEEFVSLKIYNVLGQEVTTLVNQQMKAGVYSFDVNASRLSSGVYFYRIEAGKFSATKKMLLMK
ncbi:MAG: T9SS type A sorting domain-containing protein [Ignavibacteriales bacterium]|nr:T9SS type A sorting domain-containing protein [Ignavibacteriales bacterium]